MLIRMRYRLIPILIAIFGIFELISAKLSPSFPVVPTSSSKNVFDDSKKLVKIGKSNIQESILIGVGSILMGGGLFVGFKVAELLEKIIRKKSLKPTFDPEMQSIMELRAEQDELWRINHQIYNEITERLGNLTLSIEENSLKSTNLVSRLAEIEEIINSTNDSHKNENYQILSKKFDDKLLSSKQSILDIINKIKSELIDIINLKEEILSEKISGYIKEIKKIFDENNLKKPIRKREDTKKQKGRK